MTMPCKPLFSPRITVAEGDDALTMYFAAPRFAGGGGAPGQNPTDGVKGSDGNADARRQLSDRRPRAKDRYYTTGTSYFPVTTSTSFRITCRFPRIGLIFVGVFPVAGYFRVTGISTHRNPSRAAFTAR